MKKIQLEILKHLQELNSDDIRAIIEEEINSSKLQPAEKTAISKTVEKLSAEALETVVYRLINEDINKTPDFFKWLQTLV